MGVFHHCPPSVGSVEDLCTDQACIVKGIACRADILFVIKVRDAMTAKTGTAEKRVVL